MPLLDYLLQTTHNYFLPPDPGLPHWLKFTSSIAPLVTLLTAIANIFLAIVVFRFTRRKNENDRNIKWFQELVYAPNKEAIQNYFISLHNLKKNIPLDRDLSEDERINLMEQIKTERSELFLSFVDIIKPIALDLHNKISEEVDFLTDELIKALDNDELKLHNEKTYSREITNKIINCRNRIYVELFNYKG